MASERGMIGESAGRWLLSFVGSTVIAGSFAAAFKHMIPWNEAILNILLTGFVLVASALLVLTRDDITREIDRSRIATYARFKDVDPEGDKEIYTPMIRRMRDANKSIKIIGSFRESESSASPSRLSYYADMDRVILEKLRANRDFTYERIVQVNEVRAGNVLHQDQVDEVLFQHCSYMLHEKWSKPFAGTLSLRQIGTVLPSLTFIIIDEVDIILCLPYIDRDGSSFRTEQLGTALFFQDRGGDLKKELERTFAKVQAFASEIESTASSSLQESA